MLDILKGLKSIFVHIRSSLKLIILITISIALIVGAILLIYKPMYRVTLNGEFIGYTSNKSNLQARINNYIENGSEGSQNLSFVDISAIPEYSLCLLKRSTPSNDDEIYAKVTENGVSYYRYYAIVLDSEEKYYVESKEKAEEIIDTLKEKSSSNIDKIAYTEKNSTELEDFTDTETAVAGLYSKKVVVAKRYTSIGASASYAKPKLGITLIKPVSGTISSRFGSRWGGTHTGLDIAGSTGTPILAAASGTVTYVNYSNYSYGNVVKISHGNGVETLYAHCNTLNVSKGDKVSQGQQIATRGSTGNSTGPHLHFEVRVDGVAVNPQNYVY